jgi:hypothetical protein
MADDNAIVYGYEIQHKLAYENPIQKLICHSNA